MRKLILLLVLFLCFSCTFVSAAHNAEFVVQGAPLNMIVGRDYDVYVTMRNTGDTVWTQADEFKLGSTNPSGNVRWGFSRVDMDSTDSVAPGGEKKFVFTITAPSTQGTYNFQWKMVKEGATWFGETSTNVQIKVNPVPSSNLNLTEIPSTHMFGSTPIELYKWKNIWDGKWYGYGGNFRWGNRGDRIKLG